MSTVTQVRRHSVVPSTNQQSIESITPARFAIAAMVGVCLFGILGIVGYARYVSHDAKQLADPFRARREGRPIPVRTEVIEQAQFEQVIGATAVAQSSRMATVRFGGSGNPSGQGLVLSKVIAQEGQAVQAGDVLFEVDEESLRLVLKQNEFVETSAEAEYLGTKQLFERKAASHFEFRTAEIKYESAKLETELARKNLAACKIVSPICGHLDIVEVVGGEVFDSNLELTTVHCLDPIHVRVEVPQERASEVVLGRQAEVVIDSFPQEAFHGKIISVSPQVDADTRVLSTVVEVTNPEYRIKSGMSGFARFREDKEALLVPDAAIVVLNGKATTFVVVNGQAVLREVRTGPLAETGKRVVLSGLSPGEEVVVYGQQYLLDNDPVDTDWRQWMRRKSLAEMPEKESKEALLGAALQ